jgi:dolichol kinase
MAAAITALFTRCGYYAISPPSAAASAIAATAFIATVAESLPLNKWVDDNVTVPALAGLVGWWLLRPV